ncbi:MAG: helix-turn-helix domain-containing protein [Lachnospiraceae bacterium]|nr:helix-turn-helix domain-containing protein [Lachnospiraceae bacterium]
METKLAENIRLFRKQKSLTQEQLAEVLGVTVGAVHKWETRLSTPELNLITEMADFFDVSVDVLLGHEMRDNRQQATVDRLIVYLNTENPEGIEAAEKAMKRFPHAFEVVLYSALICLVVGGKRRDNSLLDRAKELLNESLILLPQNKDQNITEFGIYSTISSALMLQGKFDESVELLKKHNPEGIYGANIGMTLSLMCRKPEEAEKFLAPALVEVTGKMLQSVLGYANVYIARGKFEDAKGMIRWGIDFLEGAKTPGVTGFVDRDSSYLYTLLAFAEFKDGDPSGAKKAMHKAKKLAADFDAAPNFDARSFRWAPADAEFSLHEPFGETALESLGFIVRMFADQDFTAFWEEN